LGESDLENATPNEIIGNECIFILFGVDILSPTIIRMMPRSEIVRRK
jgi:hypothetical protein